MKHMLIPALTVFSASLAFAGNIVVDGQLDAGDLYGSAVAVQSVQTQFGDSNLGVIDFANGSELDNAYGRIDLTTQTLYLFLGGNLESNFNKLEVFIDFKAGGQNKLRGDNPDVDFNGLNRMGDDGSGNGLRFDRGFAADFYLTLTGGNNPYATFANTAEVLTKGGGTGQFIGSGGAGTNVLLGANGQVIGINNSNTGGVSSGTGASSGKGVTTGIEISIPFGNLSGYTGAEDIRVCAFINGGGHDFVSNQVLGTAGAGVGNLGEPRNVDLSILPGDQYFTIVAPEPTLSGDVDGDGFVNGVDLGLVLGAWGNCPSGKGGCPADLNGDGFVDGADLAIVLGDWTG